MAKYNPSGVRVKPGLLTLGYDLDKWHGSGIKTPVEVDISPSTNSHMIICGMSGAGKTYAEQSYIAKLMLAQSGTAKNAEADTEYRNGIFYFADYKGDDSFAHLRGCPRYYSYKNTLNALDAVYAKLNARLSGEDESRQPVTLVWDEYMANILALTGADKDRKPAEKLAPKAMNAVSEILLMGRSMSVRLVTSCQRPDAIAFPAGSRLNYGIVLILGAAVRSIYEMLMPDHMEQVKGRKFGRGEGVVLLQGSELHFIKIPQVRDYDRMKQICIQSLS